MTTEDQEREIGELAEALTVAAEPDALPPLTPAWWQKRVLDWATSYPRPRTKLLRFVDVLPTLESRHAVADHVRQYFREDAPVLVQTASGLASHAAFRPVLSSVVRRGVFAMAERFIAGATAAEAGPRLRELAESGVACTVDLLGEATLSSAEADAYLGRYSDLLTTLSRDLPAHGPAGEGWTGVPPVSISVKLTALHPFLEPAAPQRMSEAIRERFVLLLRLARERGAFVNVDMEQFRYKDLVHRVFADVVLDAEFARNANLGIVVQAYLRDSLDDIAVLRGLVEQRGTPFTVRLVKGAYWDEERIIADQNGWPAPVYEEKRDTDASFERCTEALLSAWPRLRPALGTHNPRSVAQAIVRARRADIPNGEVEFQTLHGMAEGLRDAIGARGYRTRVYVPVGDVIPGMA